jgi:transposase
MNTSMLFAQALGIVEPWYVEGIKFSAEAQRLDIRIDFRTGAKFMVADDSGTEVGPFPAYDTVEKRWRHLNFFQHECHLSCRVPRVRTSGGQTLRVKVPWEGVNSGFTMLFEALLLIMVGAMPVHAVARMAKVSDNKLWRLMKKYVEQALATESLAGVTQLGVDETSMGKGHDYVTVAADLDFEARRTVFVAKGRDSENLAALAEEMRCRGGDPAAVTDFTCDMSKAYLLGIASNFPAAQVTFDKFHLVKLLNDALDKVRRREVLQHPVLKKARWLLLKNEANLNADQAARLADIRTWNLDTCRALQLRMAFQDLYQAEDGKTFARLFDRWLSWARRCRLGEFRRIARTFTTYRDGIVRWFETRLSNAILEGINSLIQATKAKARGFRTFENFRTAIFFVTGHLDFSKINPAYRPL